VNQRDLIGPVRRPGRKHKTEFVKNKAGSFDCRGSWIEMPIEDRSSQILLFVVFVCPLLVPCVR